MADRGFLPITHHPRLDVTMNEYWPWLTLVGLGAFHGVNPGMGWLFAVALGLQERSRGAVLRAFGPIALGHAASVVAVVLLMGVAFLWIDAESLRALGAVALVLFGAYKILAPLSHPRWVGMRVKARELTVWSFLMATAHGAGLMLVPVLLRLPTDSSAHSAHAAHMGTSGQAVPMAAATVLPDLAMVELAAIGVHTAAMFLVMALVAVVVFEKVGLGILRRAWFNLDRLWASALIASGVLTFLF
jgi:hypothetical protein